MKNFTRFFGTASLFFMLSCDSVVPVLNGITQGLGGQCISLQASHALWNSQSGKYDLHDKHVNTDDDGKDIASKELNFIDRELDNALDNGIGTYEEVSPHSGKYYRIIVTCNEWAN